MYTAATGKIRYRAVFALSLISLLGVPALAQERYGEFTGTVMDATGAAIPGAKITFTNKDTSVARVATTGPNGTYIERNMEPGRYSVRAEAKGFSAFETGEVILLVGRTVKLEPKLTVGALDQVVTVSDAAIREGVRFVGLRMKVLVEPTGAIPAAALMSGALGALDGLRVGAIISGGNVDPDVLCDILNA